MGVKCIIYELNGSTHCSVAKSTELFAYYPLVFVRKRVDELELCYFQVFCSNRMLG